MRDNRARPASSPRAPAAPLTAPPPPPPPPAASFCALLGTTYLPSAGLVGLYEEPERPPNAIEYVKKVLGAPVGVDVDALRAENEQLKALIASLKEQLAAHKPPQ